MVGRRTRAGGAALIGGMLFLATASASGQPGEPTEAPTRAPILVATPEEAATPIPEASPLAADTAGAAAAVATPTAIATAEPTPVGPAISSAEPGADRALTLPAFAGDPATPLGNEQIFAKLTPLRKAWFVREYYRLRGDAPKAQNATDALLELRLDSGLENAMGIAAALAAEARELSKENKDAEAVTAADAATKLAPDYTAAWTTLARVQLGAGAVGATFSALDGAARATLRNLRARLRVLGNGWMALLGGTLLAYGVFLLVAFVRYARFLAHDFRHALADNLPAAFAVLILIPFLLFPLVFGIGPFALLAWWTVVLWIKLSSRERMVAAVFLLVAAALPFLLERAALTFAFEGGPASRLFAATHEDELTARDFAELEALGKAENDPEVLLTLAIAHQRNGRYSQAQQLYERARDAGAGGAAWVGIGSIHYARGHIAEAIAALEKGAADAPLVASFNLSQIYGERTELAKATAALETAKRIDAEACERFMRRKLADARRTVNVGGATLVSAPYVNRFLMVQPVSDAALIARAARSAKPLAERTWARISPALPLRGVTGVFLGALVVCVLLTAAFRGTIPSRPCPRCGRSLCLRCDGPPLEGDLCTQCFHAFVQNEGVDPRQRAAKELEINRHQERTRRRRRLLSFFFPGSGQLFAGETVRGAILVLIFSLAIVRALFWRGWFRPVFPVPGMVTAIVAATLAGVVALGAWIVAQRAADEKGA